MKEIEYKILDLDNKIDVSRNSQFMIDFMEEIIDDYFQYRDHENPVSSTEVSALIYRISNIIEIYDDNKKHDLEILSELNSLLVHWYSELENKYEVQ